MLIARPIIMQCASGRLPIKWMETSWNYRTMVEQIMSRYHRHPAELWLPPASHAPPLSLYLFLSICLPPMTNSLNEAPAVLQLYCQSLRALKCFAHSMNSRTERDSNKKLIQYDWRPARQQIPCSLNKQHAATRTILQATQRETRKSFSLKWNLNAKLLQKIHRGFTLYLPQH